jgi:hypothetical protein
LRSGGETQHCCRFSPLLSTSARMRTGSIAPSAWPTAEAGWCAPAGPDGGR